MAKNLNSSLRTCLSARKEWLLMSQRFCQMGASHIRCYCWPEEQNIFRSIILLMSSSEHPRQWKAKFWLLAAALTCTYLRLNAKNAIFVKLNFIYRGPASVQGPSGPGLWLSNLMHRVASVHLRISWRASSLGSFIRLILRRMGRVFGTTMNLDRLHLCLLLWCNAMEW